MPDARPWRRFVVSHPTAAVFLVLAVGGAVALGLVWRHDVALAHAYASAPACNTLAAAAPRADCWYGLSATVTDRHIGKGKGARYWLELRGDPPADGEISFPNEAGVLDAVRIGDTAHVTVWHGRVVRVEAFGYSDVPLGAPRYGVRRAGAGTIWLAATVPLIVLVALRHLRERHQFRFDVAQRAVTTVWLTAFLPAFWYLDDPSPPLTVMYPSSAGFAVLILSVVYVQERRQRQSSRGIATPTT